jgi:hypothetical protein
VPLFETQSLESDSEADFLPMHSKCIHNVLTRKLSHNSNFGVYQDDKDGSFNLRRSGSTYNNKDVFVDSKNYKANQGLWELLAKSKLDKNLVTLQDRQAYKQILFQSNGHRVNYSPKGRIRANKRLKYTRLISRISRDRQVSWETLK